MSLCLTLTGLTLIWLLFAEDLWMFYLFALAFGLAWGGMSPVMAAIIGDTFGLSRMGAILGVLDTGFNAGAALGPVIGGIIFDIKQSYSLSFLLGMALMMVTTALIAFIRRETGRTAVRR